MSLRAELMAGFALQRLGMLMEPEPGNPQEVEGVLNPAAARGPDGQLYIFPRLVARGNYSRIGIARVRFNEAGNPAGAERLGIALEPEADYERGWRWMRGPSHHVRRATQALCDDLHSIFHPRPPHRPRLSEDLFHGSAWGSLLWAVSRLTSGRG